MVVTAMAVMAANCMFTVMLVTVEAIGMAVQSIGMGTPIGTVAIGMVAIGMEVAIGIGGMVGGGLTVLDRVGEWSLAAGSGFATDLLRNTQSYPGLN
jgi:hypothetical protein